MFCDSKNDLQYILFYLLAQKRKVIIFEPLLNKAYSILGYTLYPHKKKTDINCIKTVQ